MGWCSGDTLLADVWELVRAAIPEEKRVPILAALIKRFEEENMACWDAIGALPEGREALKILHPDRMD